MARGGEASHRLLNKYLQKLLDSVIRNSTRPYCCRYFINVECVSGIHNIMIQNEIRKKINLIIEKRQIPRQVLQCASFKILLNLKRCKPFKNAKRIILIDKCVLSDYDIASERHIQFLTKSIYFSLLRQNHTRYTYPTHI